MNIIESIKTATDAASTIYQFTNIKWTKARVKKLVVASSVFIGASVVIAIVESIGKDG